MGKPEIESFLSHLATNRKVAASTQRQAQNALVFLYKNVLDKPIGGNIAPVKTKKRRRPTVVMTKAEIRQVLNQMKRTASQRCRHLYYDDLKAQLLRVKKLHNADLDAG